MIHLGLNKNTITGYMNIIRAAMSYSNEANNLVIGGPGVIVEIDEAKFGKSKYNVGRVIEGQWILGGLERDHPSKTFLIPVPDRSHDTLKTCIMRYVLPGTTIYTDMWRGYIGIDNCNDYKHLTVNHK